VWQMDSHVKFYSQKGEHKIVWESPPTSPELCSSGFTQYRSKSMGKALKLMLTQPAHQKATTGKGLQRGGGSGGYTAVAAAHPESLFTHLLGLEK